MGFKVEKDNSPINLDVKRFYAPFKIHTKCEECGTDFNKDYQIECFYYPEANNPFEEYLHCPECDHEHEVKLLLTMDLKIVEED